MFITSTRNRPTKSQCSNLALHFPVATNCLLAYEEHVMINDISIQDDNFDLDPLNSKMRTGPDYKLEQFVASRTKINENLVTSEFEVLK